MDAQSASGDRTQPSKNLVHNVQPFAKRQRRNFTEKSRWIQLRSLQCAVSLYGQLRPFHHGRAILKRKEMPNFIAHGADSHPAGFVHPEAIQQSETARLSTNGPRSKTWEELSAPGAPSLDFVFTVCGNAAKEICPV